jgi:hypothetical protein
MLRVPSQSLSIDFVRGVWLCGQAAALVVRKPKAAAAELNSKDAVLFAKVFDRMLLLLIHPSGDRNEKKAERVQRLCHGFSG